APTAEHDRGNAAPPESLSRGSPVGHRLLEFLQIVEARVVVVKVDHRPPRSHRGHPVPNAAWRAGVLRSDLPGALQPFHPLLPDRGLDANLPTQVRQVADE